MNFAKNLLNWKCLFLTIMISIICDASSKMFSLIASHRPISRKTPYTSINHSRKVEWHYTCRNSIVLSLSGGFEKLSSDDRESEIPLSDVYGDEISDSNEESSTPESSDTAEEKLRLSGPILDPILPMRLTPYNHIPFLELWPGLGPQVQPGQVLIAVPPTPNS